MHSITQTLSSSLIRMTALGLLAGFLMTPSAPAAIVWSGESVSTTSGQPIWGNLADYPTGDLTALGTTDWAYFGISDDAPVIVNRKNGGTALSAPTINRTGLEDPGDAVAHFDFTDGTSPASGSDVNAGMGVQAGSDWQASIPSPVLELDVPMVTADSELHLWFIHSESGIKIEAFDGGTEVGTEIDLPTTGDSTGYHYKLTYGGETGNLTFRLTHTSTSQGGSYIGLAGAALTVIPEPGTLALLGIAFGVLVLGTRRKRG